MARGLIGGINTRATMQRFYLRRKLETPPVVRVKERLYPERLAREHQGPICFIPDRECVHAHQMVDALGTPLEL